MNVNCVGCPGTRFIVGSKPSALLSTNANAAKSSTSQVPKVLYQLAKYKYKKNVRTEIKLNGSLTMTKERLQNQTLVFTFSIIMANAARRQGSSRMMCCMFHRHLTTF